MTDKRVEQEVDEKTAARRARWRKHQQDKRARDRAKAPPMTLVVEREVGEGER